MDIDNVNVDWPRLIKDLKGEGVSMAKIAKRAGCSVPSVRKARDDASADPQWSLAATIIQMHSYWCGGDK
jgi:lambda repressor-like predicted transcriptional regulator